MANELVGGSGLPVGTPEEVKAKGASLAAWGTCSARDTSLIKSRGCNHFHECIFSFKGKPVEEGGGPRNQIVYIKADTGASVERPLPCFVYMETLHKRATAEGTGEVIAIVGGEGDEYERVSTDSVERHSKTNMRVKRKVEKAKCQPFPRPGEEGSAMGPDYVLQTKMEARLKDRARVIRQLEKEGIDVSELAVATGAKDVEAPRPGKRG